MYFRTTTSAMHRVLGMLAALFVLTGIGFAQDTLVYVNGNRIVGTVEEIGLDQVRYHTTSAGNQVAIVVPKTELARVKLAGGQEIVLNGANATSVAPDVMARKHVIKLDFLAPALNHFVLGYEQAIGPRMNIEATVGLIGLGTYGEYRNQQGFMAKTGIKFILRTRRNRLGSYVDEGPLGGFYLRPALMVSAWKRDDVYYTGGYPYPAVQQQRSTRFTSAALNMEVGRQYILGKHVTFDMYLGLGYGAQWIDHDVVDVYQYFGSDYREEYAFSHAFFGSRSPLTVSAGLLFGYAF
jgi:hypothetical protein